MALGIIEMGIVSRAAQLRSLSGPESMLSGENFGRTRALSPSRSEALGGAVVYNGRLPATRKAVRANKSTGLVTFTSARPILWSQAPSRRQIKSVPRTSFGVAGPFPFDAC